MMKALSLNKPRHFDLIDVEVPRIEEEELLLKIHYAGICGSDLSTYKAYKSGDSPRILGHEFCGEVVQIGSRAEGFKPGELVVVNPFIPCGKCRLCKKGAPQRCPERIIVGGQRQGAFAEYVNVPAASCFRISDPLAGTLVEPLACAVRAARLADIEVGDAVTVFGAGMIGLLCLKVAQLMGATKLILIDTNDSRLNFGKGWGATDLLNPQHLDIKDAIIQAAGGPVQKVIDAVGLETTRQTGIQVLENGGRIVLIGRHQDQLTIPGDEIVRREIQMIGTFCYSHEDFRQALTLIEQKIITPDRAWLSVRPLEEGKRAFDEQIEGPASYPKIVIRL